MQSVDILPACINFPKRLVHKKELFTLYIMLLIMKRHIKPLSSGTFATKKPFVEKSFHFILRFIILSRFFIEIQAAYRDGRKWWKLAKGLQRVLYAFPKITLFI